LKVTVILRSLVKVSTVQINPDSDTESQPSQPANLPSGAAVRVIVLPLGMVVLHDVAVLAQLRPRGELVMVPDPVPGKVTARFGPESAAPVKHTTFAVMVAVMMAPDELRPPTLWFVCTVAVMRAFPQSMPVAVNTPAELTVAKSGVFEVQVTWSVMSLVTGGWI